MRKRDGGRKEKRQTDELTDGRKAKRREEGRKRAEEEEKEGKRQKKEGWKVRKRQMN